MQSVSYPSNKQIEASSKNDHRAILKNPAINHHLTPILKVIFLIRVMASPRPIENLLSLTSRVETLPLKQLVSIHRALINAIDLNHQSRNFSLDCEPEYDHLIEQLVGDEIDTFNEIFRNGGLSQKKLLLVQYLLHGVTGLSRFKILLPLLSQPFMISQLDEEELREAILSAVFDETIINDDEISKLSTAFLEELPFIWSCRFLVRLHSQCCVEELVLHETLLGMKQPENLRPVTAWLLPLLLEKNPSSFVVDSIWKACLAQIELAISEDEKQSDALLLVSSLVCACLPFFSSPNQLFPTTSDERLEIRQQSKLWRLISCLLQRGSDCTKPKEGSNDQTLRRRGLYILRLIVESEKDDKFWQSLWLKYVACFETIEMEIDQHLIDQIWETVAELCGHAALCSEVKKPFLPSMTWEWIAMMLSRLFLCDTPVLRKLALYRFLNGDVGIQIEVPKTTNLDQKDGSNHQTESLTKKGGRKVKAKSSATPKVAPLAMVPTEFVLDIIIGSYDTLSSSIGTKIKIERESKIQVHEITPKLTDLIVTYTQVLDNQGLEKILVEILGPYIGRLRSKTAVLLLEAISKGLKTLPDKAVCLTEKALLEAINGFQSLFHDGAVIITHRQRLMFSFAIILSKSNFKDGLDPKSLLQTLSLFLDAFGEEQIDPSTQAALQEWVRIIGDSSDWSSNSAAACAASFVQMDLLSQFRESWEPFGASSKVERKMGAAIALLALLSVGEGEASSLLWPAVHKGLKGLSPSSATAWYNADKASRAMIILEHGCKYEILSGLGNGDLVVDEKTQQMLPPPPNIENLLKTAVEFLMNHIRAISTGRKDSVHDLKSSNDTNSPFITANQVSATFAISIMQLRIFAESYPSSFSVSSASEKILESSINTLISLEDEDSIEAVAATSLLYAALSCGADPDFQRKQFPTVKICAKLLRINLCLLQGSSISAREKKVARSVFHYARWGCLSIILPKFMASVQSSKVSEISDFLEQVPSRALDLIEATPIDALLPLFDCVKGVANSWLPICGDSSLYPSYLSMTINALFSAMSDVSASRTFTHMLNEICSLIFRPELLLDEYQRLQLDSNYQAPIREAFLKLMKMSSKTRSYVLRAAVCHICAGWLDPGSGDDAIPGIGAIPYVNEIAELLIYKEKKLDELETKKSVLTGSEQKLDTSLFLPPDTNETSIVRGFLFLFLSRLPNPADGLDDIVLKELLHPLIIRIIEEYCLAPLKSGSSLIFGSADYSLRIRSWQALCILSRFVSSEIAEFVCQSIFQALGQQLNGKIRFFLEVFAIQFARKHSVIFCDRFVKTIIRVDLSLQEVSSLMIIGGNVIVGNYKTDFFRQLSFNEEKNKQNILHQILRGVIPWLSSTQGFSRATAQLLVYSLIPLVTDVSQLKNQPQNEFENEWYLWCLYQFLDQNSDMKRLRKKQIKVFGGYDVDNVCDVKGLLNIKVDEGDEANPDHMVDLIKKSLERAHHESREKVKPKCEYVEQLMMQNSIHDSSSDDCNNKKAENNTSFQNFQRKINPLDTLDLGLQQSHDAALQNACGRKRQKLIICASLVDKIPNLGGLSRTAEIFAADRLVIPDMNVVKTELFKSLSVGAANWIPMEQCREDVSNTTPSSRYCVHLYFIASALFLWISR